MPAAAAALERDKAAFARIAPPCPYYGRCGGCSLQDLEYADQAALKRSRVEQALAPLRGVPGIAFHGAPDPWRYRNKAELTFSEDGERLTLGYHAARSFWRVVDIDDCLLLPAPMACLARRVRELARASELPAYHPRTHRGFFRYLIVRSSPSTGQLLACLVTTSGGVPGAADEATARAAVERLAAEVTDAHPELAGFYWGVTDRLADVAVPERLALLAGAPHLADRLGAFRIRLGPLSFLQPNSAQAEQIYNRLSEALVDAPVEGAGAPSPGGRVAWDLYCGLGLVSLYLSAAFGTVYAIDSEPGYLELAAVNAALNQAGNIRFRTGRVEELLRDRRFWLQEARPDAVVVDPPRAGLHPQALASVQTARPARLAYLSCNVQTLARDLAALQSGYPRYRIASVDAFDMFPQTPHVETLVILAR